MRLIEVQSLLYHEFHGDQIPPYAILLHTWGEGEFLFQDLLHERYESKPGVIKLCYCAEQAAKDGLHYI